MSAREDARRSWRERVNAAARAWSRSEAREMWLSIPWTQPRRPYSWHLDEALAAPKPWRSSRKPDARRRYSRAHRRACEACRKVAPWHRYPVVSRDPHGRRA